MQFLREGIDDTQEGREDSPDSEAAVNLSKHFLDNGLSQSAHTKMAPEIENGDMNASILIDCNDNELNIMANQYHFTFLQRKAFIKAVNLLKLNSKNATTNNKNSNVSGSEARFIPVYVSPEEQSMLNEINELAEIVGKYRTQCISTKRII